jgi:hypothetical protein
MRSHRSPARLTKLASVLGATLLWLTGMTQVALAQQSLNPTVTPVKDTGGWVYWMAEGAIVIGGIILLIAAASYLRFAPRFSRDEESEGRVPRAGRRAPHEPSLNLQTVWTQSSPVAVEPVPPPSAAPAPAAQPAAVGAPAAAAPAQAPAPAAGAAPAAAAQAAPAPAAGPAAAPPRPKGEPIELDQETYDRVLAEEQAKGTSQRVAEGRAKSAALKAARAKAEG